MGSVVSPVFAGRHDAVARLASALTRATAGEPATVLVDGEAGVGKSRLVAEFVATAAGNARVLTGGCVELGGEGLPFAPFVAAMRALTGELDDGERERLAPLLPGQVAVAHHGDDARSRLFESLLGLLARLAAEGPVVLVLEDLHWAERSSRELLDFLVRNQAAAPGTVFVGTCRSDDVGRAHPLRPLLAELTRVSWVDHLLLPRLGHDAVVRQIRGILGREPAPEVVRTVFERSEGNPLFVEALVDNPAEVPSSLASLLLSKAERLPGEAAAVLRVAAVGGPRVPHRLLAAVAGSGTLGALRTAVDAGVLRVDRDEYVFRHALIRDAVYESLLPGERTELHARYAAALTAEADGTGAGAGELAYHLSAAGDTAGALSAAWKAARQARSRLAYAEELRMLERVLAVWDRVPDRAERIGRDHASVLEQAALAAARAGEHQRGERYATAALAEIDHERERLRAALLLDQRGQLRTQLGAAGARDDHEAAVRLVPESHQARGYLLNSLADHLMRIPLPDEAKEAAEGALEAAQRAGDDPVEASALITLAVLEARLGDLDAQLPNFAKARAIAENVRAHGVRLRALHSEAHLLHAFGRLADAEVTARLGVAAAREAGLARSTGALHAINLVNAQLAAGRWREARESIGHALELSQRGSSQSTLLGFKVYLSLHEGALDEAESILIAARDQLADPGLPQDPLLLTRLEAQLRLAQGRVGEAEAVVAHALDLPYLSLSSRFTWPLLIIGARIAVAAEDGGGDGDELRARLRAQAATTRVAGPVQAAGATLFAAEAAVHDPGPWAAAVSEWELLGQPLRIAEALLGQARARLTAGDDRRDVAPGLRRAAALATDLGAEPLLDDVTAVARRATITLSPGAERPAQAPHGLTPREVEILRLVAEGLSNREIAEQLFIAAKTASVHVSNILGKLDAANRAEAATAAHRLGLLA